MILKKLPYCSPEAEALETLAGSVICDSGILGDPGNFDDGGDPFVTI